MKVTLDLKKLSRETRLAIARETESKKVLEALSKDDYWKIRYIIAGKPKTPQKVLRELSKDSNWDVRYKVARNPKTTKDILKEILENEESGIIKEEAEGNLREQSSVEEDLSKEDIQMAVKIFKSLKD